MLQQFYNKKCNKQIFFINNLKLLKVFYIKTITGMPVKKGLLNGIIKI